MSFIARTHDYQGKHDMVLERYNDALLGQEKLLGDGSLLKLDAVYGIAIVYKDPRQHSDAVQSYERALMGRKRILGRRSPSSSAT